MREVAVAVIVFALFSFLLSPLLTASGSVSFVDGGLGLDVYVVALEGVEAQGVDNVSRVVEGVQAAVTALDWEGYKYWWGTEQAHLGTVNPGGNYTYWEESTMWGGLLGGYVKLLFPVNVSVHIISDWSDYRSIVESAGESIVINVHGETLPVPAGYTGEAWVGRIAEAMLYRNLTWVHVGGYPFYYYQQEDSGLEEWGELGFQQLMKHIGRANVTCESPSPSEKAYLSANAIDALIRGTWSGLYIEAASMDYPLKKADFEGKLAMNIWNPGVANYFTGAVIAFKELDNQSSHGFYVHVGTLQTFGSEGESTDRDFWRANAGCASGLWAVLGRSVAEYKLAEAEAVIMKAEREGRTDGLEEAYDLLNQAKAHYCRYSYHEGVITHTYRAIVKAEEAQTPPPPPTPALIDILGLSVIVSVILGSVIIWRKRNS